MKKLILLILSFLVLLSCKETPKNDLETFNKPLFTNEMMETAIIYEANIRQYSPEGTFKAFTKDIPKLKEDFGVKIIWLMPIYPISMTKRKAKGDVFVKDIKDKEERKKYLGSYYAVSDFRAVSADYGTMDDLRQLIKVAHDNDMLVILDWVPNHTGWDHSWIKNHPDYYTKNAKGEITDPLNDDGSSKGWQDVADLNYDNKELHKTMTADMKYWLTDENIDGFRCDVAGEVPVDFWKSAIAELRQVKPIFMLAEAWEPELLKENMFDMCYGWESHFLMVDIAQGKKTVKDWDKYMANLRTKYEMDDIIMNFTSNHDENSWKGTVKQTFGDASEVMAVLSYMTSGMPLIYSGQEFDLNKKLRFFEKDTIPHVKGKFYDFYKKMKALKTKNPALYGGKKSASYTRIKTSDDNHILAFTRENKGQKATFIANLSNKDVTFTSNFAGSVKNYFTKESQTFSKDTDIHLKPWDYLVLVE
jgi:glycosidase